MDLYKYHIGLQEHKLLEKGALDKAYIPYKNNYGYGWMINAYDGKMIVSHSGGAAGYRSNFARIQKDNICIVLLNNTENASLEIITRKIIDILYGRPYKVPFEVKVDNQILEKFVGSYAVNPTFTMYITIDNGKLSAQASGQQKTILLAEKENYFFAEEANGFLEFTKNDNGAYNELIIHQGGQDIKAKRFHAVWGLLGSATPNGWGGANDIKFSEDTTKRGLWILNNIKLNTGKIKFRFNNDWNINYGDNNSDNLLDMYGDNIKVQAGTYEILLDFTDEKNPKYTFIKKL